MKNRCYAAALLLILLSQQMAYAKLSESALNSIGQFLATDIKSVSGDNGVIPVSYSFFVKETRDFVVIDKKEILSIHGYDDVKKVFSPGKYRRIIIVNDILKYGCIVRDAYINDHGQVYWYDYSQSLLKFEARPELGNTGVMKIMDYGKPSSLADIFRDARRGVMPSKWQPTPAELEYYIKSLNIIYSILINRD